MEKEKIQILLDEFKALREEISRRSKDQLSLIQMNITAIGVILGFVISSVKDSRVLLIIPLVSSVLGIIYLDNAEAIQHIGRFIQRQIKPAMFAIVRQELPDYESYVRGLEIKRADRLFMVGARTSSAGRCNGACRPTCSPRPRVRSARWSGSPPCCRRASSACSCSPPSRSSPAAVGNLSEIKADLIAEQGPLRARRRDTSEPVAG
jgi:hypothetical protein